MTARVFSESSKGTAGEALRALDTPKLRGFLCGLGDDKCELLLGSVEAALEAPNLALLLSVHTVNLCPQLVYLFLLLGTARHHH